jgi:hypothetical protein
MRIPPSVLKTHNQRDDAWAAINGKVYNITPYLSYHPGGEKELMRVAGRDGTKLFSEYGFWRLNAQYADPSPTSSHPCLGECRIYARCVSGGISYTRTKLEPLDYVICIIYSGNPTEYVATVL